MLKCLHSSRAYYRRVHSVSLIYTPQVALQAVSLVLRLSFLLMQGIFSIASPLGAGYRNTATWDVVFREHSCTERKQWPDPGKRSHILVEGLSGCSY